MSKVKKSMWKGSKDTQIGIFIFWKIIYFQSKINDMLPYKKCKKRDNVQTVTAERSLEL